MECWPRESRERGSEPLSLGCVRAREISKRTRLCRGRGTLPSAVSELARFCPLPGQVRLIDKLARTDFIHCSGEPAAVAVRCGVRSWPSRRRTTATNHKLSADRCERVQRTALEQPGTLWLTRLRRHVPRRRRRWQWQRTATSLPLQTQPLYTLEIITYGPTEQGEPVSGECHPHDNVASLAMRHIHGVDDATHLNAVAFVPYRLRRH